MELEPQFTQDFEVEIDGETTSHNVSLFEYKKSIVLKTTKELGSAFSKYLKEASGKWNPHLGIGPGWVFPQSKNEELNEVLQKIHSGELKSQRKKFIKPDLSKNSREKKILNLVKMLEENIPQDSSEILFEDNEDLELYIHFNREEDTITRGECVYLFETSKKKLEIFQLAKP